MSNIISFIETNDDVLLEHGVWILNNLLSDSDESYIMICQSKVEERVCQLLKRTGSLRLTKIILLFYKNLQKFPQKLKIKPDINQINLVNKFFMQH